MELVVHVGSAEAVQAVMQKLQVTWRIVMLA